MDKVEHIAKREPGHHPPVGQGPGKKEEVQAMFDAIARRYDLLNRMLSAGIDQRWRRAATAALGAAEPKRVLDVATGTGDLAIAVVEAGIASVVGVDIAEEMLEVAREKVRRRGLEERVTLRTGDAERLPFSDRQFDAATVAFGVRNFEDLQRGLQEIRRVLRPGAMVVVLEFSSPRRFPVKQLYAFYSRFILPWIGRLVSRDKGAYTYLPESIRAFPDGEAFLDELHRAGFEQVEARPLT